MCLAGYYTVLVPNGFDLPILPNAVVPITDVDGDWHYTPLVVAALILVCDPDALLSQ
jgi:hypothetical protein